MVVAVRPTVAYATAFVAAAHKYQLWVNGAQVATGPSFCFPDEQYYQATDVTAALRAGADNAVGILHHWYGPGRGRPTSAPGVLVQVVAHYVDGRTVVLGTNGRWRTRGPPNGSRHPNATTTAATSWSGSTPGSTRIGWAGAGFDDRDWYARLGHRARWARRPSPTSTPSAPASPRSAWPPRRCAPWPPARWWSTSARSTPAGPRSPSGRGPTVTPCPCTSATLLDPDGAVSTTHNTQVTDLSFSNMQRDGAQTFDPYWYLGFRYLQVDDPGEAIGTDQVTLVARHATMPAGPPPPSRRPSPELDAVWQLCAHSGLYTSQEQFIDTPTREKGQFLWDAANESQTVMRTFGDQNLSWQGLRDMARAQARYWPTTGQVNEVYPNDDGAQDYPTFTALYPEWVWRYYLSTGDRATVVGLLPTLLRLSGYLQRQVDPATGLLSGLVLSDNGDNQYGYDYNTDADTTREHAGGQRPSPHRPDRPARRRHRSSAAAESDLGTALVGHINQLLVSPAGSTSTACGPTGARAATPPSWPTPRALAYGVCPPSGRPRWRATWPPSTSRVEPDHGMELLRALHAAGRDDDVVRILTDASFPGWAAILKAGGTFTWETWTPSDLIGDSMSHGWGSSALVAIQEVLLGAVPVAPGPADPPTVVAVTPPAAVTRLDFATGSFPTPAGTYKVSWRRTGSSWHVGVGVPANAAARCTLPTTSVDHVTESGRPLTGVPGSPSPRRQGALSRWPSAPGPINSSSLVEPPAR